MVLLLSGFEMPGIGLGTWRSDKDKLRSSLIHALKTGYKHLDCAAMYGNENIVGEAIDQAGVRREDLFLTSKIMPTDMHVEHIDSALEKTLKDLKTSYIDLYLLHWPFRFCHDPSSFPVPVSERLGYDAHEISKIWAYLEKLVDSGKIRSLGVSNFSVKKVSELLMTARHPISCNQLEVHVYLQQQQVIDWHNERGIVVTTYCPLGNPARPATFVHTDDPSVTALENSVICKIAQHHKCSPAQVLLSWAIKRKTIPLPKSVTPSRLDENLASTVINLTEDDMMNIKALDMHHRFSRGEQFCLEGKTWQDNWDLD
jgi:alcohol dehydrogenase (NADP+)